MKTNEVVYFTLLNFHTIKMEEEKFFFLFIYLCLGIWICRYGPIFRTSLLGRSIVVTADPEINSFIYSQEGKTVELWYLDSISKVFKQDGEARTTAGGVIHKYLRSITLNHFGSESLKAKLLADIQRYVDKVLVQWSNQPSVEVQRGTLAVRLTITQLTYNY